MPWEFGCVHCLIRGSPSGEVPEVNGISSGLLGLTATAIFLHFCLHTCLSFPFPQSLHLSLERASGLSNCSIHGWAVSHLTAFTFCFLCQKACAALRPGQASAAFSAINTSTASSSATPFIPQQLPCSQNLLQSNLPIFRCTDGWISWVSWYTV